MILYLKNNSKDSAIENFQVYSAEIVYSVSILSQGSLGLRAKFIKFQLR